MVRVLMPGSRPASILIEDKTHSRRDRWNLTGSVPAPPTEDRIAFSRQDTMPVRDATRCALSPGQEKEPKREVNQEGERRSGADGERDLRIGDICESSRSAIRNPRAA